MFFTPHKSHSRKDLIELIKLFKLDIEDVEDYNKKYLIEKLMLTLAQTTSIIPDNYYYGIQNLNDLKEHLIKPNQKKTLSIKDRNDIIKSTKLIIQYCKGGYNEELSFYNTTDEIYEEARRISQFGDIPSVRRMCSLLNQNPKSKEMVYPVLSLKTQNDLKVKSITSQKYFNSLIIKKKRIFIQFD